MFILLSAEAKGMIYKNVKLFTMTWQVRDFLNIILTVTASSEHR